MSADQKLESRPLESEVETIVRDFRARTPKSAVLYKRAAHYIPGGANRNIVYVEPYPIFIAAGEGAYLIDEDENRYLDCIGNYTSMVIGHAHPDVVGAVIEQVRRGSAWAGATAAEAEVVRRIVERMPSIEQLKFTASGSEAAFMAIRGACAYTQRPLVAKFEGGYHGLGDYAMVSMAPPLDQAGPADEPRAVAPPGIAAGVRDNVVVLPFNDIGAVSRILRRHARDLACIVVEPVPGVAGILLPDDGFLQNLRTLADETGAVLIFDEVISFRVAYGGAQSLFGVKPDLTILGKIIGGGYPVGAVGGRRDIMDIFGPGSGPRVALSGTFHANPVALAAGQATLDVYSRESVDALNRLATAFFTRLRRIVDRCRVPVSLNAIGSLFNLHFAPAPVRTYRDAQRGNKAYNAALYLALLNEGVMLSPRGMGALSTAMTASDIDRLVGAFETTLARLNLA